MFRKGSLPTHGLGLGLRRYLLKETLEFIENDTENLIEWCEIVPENFINLGGKKAKQLEEVLAANIPLIPHGVNLSIGTAPKSPGEPAYDPWLITEMKKLFDQIKPPWFSDHLSCTRIGSYYLQDLIPVPRDQETVDIISDNIKFLQDEMQLPFLIENPSFYSTINEPEMSEAEFMNQIAQKADCGILLDVNNIYVNSINHGDYQPEEFLDALDLDRVVQVHIAGHLEGYESWLTGKKVAILDTHGDKIRKEVFEILEQLLKRTEVNAILLERDANFPEFSELIGELKEIKKISSQKELLKT